MRLTLLLLLVGGLRRSPCLLRVRRVGDDDDGYATMSADRPVTELEQNVMVMAAMTTTAPTTGDDGFK